jgi:hypothetical protein
MNGILPSLMLLRTNRSNSSGIICPFSLQGTLMQLSVPNPEAAAALIMEK